MEIVQKIKTNPEEFLTDSSMFANMVPVNSNVSVPQGVLTNSHAMKGIIYE